MRSRGGMTSTTRAISARRRALTASTTARPQPGSGKPLAIDSLELSEVELQIDDARHGVQGTLSLPRFSLGAFGPGLRSPLQLKARLALTEPRLSGTLELDAGLSLLPPPRPGASPLVELQHTGLRLRGQGLDLHELDLQLQAKLLQLEYGTQQGLGDSRVELQQAQLHFSSGIRSRIQLNCL